MGCSPHDTTSPGWRRRFRAHLQGIEINSSSILPALARCSHRAGNVSSRWVVACDRSFSFLPMLSSREHVALRRAGSQWTNVKLNTSFRRCLRHPLWLFFPILDLNISVFSMLLTPPPASRQTTACTSHKSLPTWRNKSLGNDGNGGPCFRRGKFGFFQTRSAHVAINCSTRRMPRRPQNKTEKAATNRVHRLGVLVCFRTWDTRSA